MMAMWHEKQSFDRPNIGNSNCAVGLSSITR